MALPWRSRRSGGSGGGGSLKAKQDKRIAAGAAVVELTIPAHFRCPISLDLMKDPVTASTGITYDRSSIEPWLDLGHPTCPVTKQRLMDDEPLIPNHSLRKMIQDWCVANRCHGVERISTPKIPVSNAQAAEIAAEIAAAAGRGDLAMCHRLAATVGRFAREGERNRRCLASNGAGRALAAAFAAVAAGGSDNEAVAEVLAAMATMLPLGEEAASLIAASPDSLSRLASILGQGRGDDDFDLAALRGAALLVKELLAAPAARDAISETEGLVEALVKLVREPVSSQTMKAALAAVFYMVSSSERAARRAVEGGVVGALVETLVDAGGEAGTCERALAVLEAVVAGGGERGREEASRHALTVPVLVKKMFRVSDAATELAVAALWRVCREGEERGGRCLGEAMAVGAFQKLLVLLQVGCSEETKEKATTLLKMMKALSNNNRNAGREECVDTMDFKGVKRPL